jgi:hypothetical protein
MVTFEMPRITTLDQLYDALAEVSEDAGHIEAHGYQNAILRHLRAAQQAVEEAQKIDEKVK